MRPPFNETTMELTCLDLTNSNYLPWTLKVCNTPGRDVDRMLTLSRMVRSTFTWSDKGVIISEGDLANDPNAFTVPVNGPCVIRYGWMFKCVSVGTPTENKP